MNTKRSFVYMLLAVLLASAGCTKHDLDEIRKSTSDLEDRVTALENKVDSINRDIFAIYAIVNTLEGYDHIISVTPIFDDNHVEIGYTITFSHSGPVNIYHGKDGTDGGNGSSPVIGVEKNDDDGKYYWTVNGEPLKDKDGNPVSATGDKGDKGDTGSSGGGANGKTPLVKIEEGTYYWMVSPNGIDRSEAYEYILVDGEKVKAKGEDGSSSIGDITVDEKGYVTITINGKDYVLPTKQTIGIGWITYIPSNGEGTAVLDGEGNHTLDFMIYPKEAAGKLVEKTDEGKELWETALRMKIRYTPLPTRAAAIVEEVVPESDWMESLVPKSLTLHRVAGAGYDIISVTIGKEKLKEDFTNGTKAAWAALCVYDGTTTISSEFTRLKPPVYYIKVPTEDDWEKSNVWHAYDENGNQVAEMFKELIRDASKNYYQAVIVNPVRNGVTDLKNGYIAQVLKSSVGNAENLAGGSVSYLSMREYTDSNRGGLLSNTKLGTETNYEYCMLESGMISGLRDISGKMAYANREYVVTDNEKDQNTYPVVRCGATYWLRENLRATYYNDGTTALFDRNTATVGKVTGEHEECARIFEDKATYAFTPLADENPENLKKYGYLYNFRAVAGDDGGDPWIMPDNNGNFIAGTAQLAQQGVEGVKEWNKQLCPKGWHIPTCNSHNVDWPDMDYFDIGLLDWKWEYAISADQTFATGDFHNWSGFSLNLIPAYAQNEDDFKISAAGAEIKDDKLVGCIPFWISTLLLDKGNKLWYPFVTPLKKDNNGIHQDANNIYANAPYNEVAGADSYPVRCVRNH